MTDNFNILTLRYALFRFYSWDLDARLQFFKIFNYDEYDPNVLYRGMLKLKELDFEDFDLRTICDEDSPYNVSGYCDLSKNVPDLDITMHLMKLAKFPLDIDDTLKKRFTNFSVSEEPLPKLSFIPTCFFGKRAQSFWNSKDYSAVTALNQIPPASYKASIEEDLNLEDPDSYRYPHCQLFSAMPTDNGVCHTFNGLDIKDILSESQWRDSFDGAFGGGESYDTLQSGGIDLEEGFVFSLDTLQSHLVTMNVRADEQDDINAFWIKVHSPGEIPWIKKDKSTWKKIEPYGNEMSTKFITLKGEKIDSKVDINFKANINKIFCPRKVSEELTQS